VHYRLLFKFTCGLKTNKSSGQHALTLKIYEHIQHVPRATFMKFSSRDKPTTTRY